MAKKLTAAGVRAAKPGVYGDLHGLRLRATASGARTWHWRGTVHGRRVDLGLGGFPYVSLKQARDMAFSYRQLSRSGGDPRRLRARRSAPTFSECMEKTIETQATSWRDPTTEKLWRSRLSAYVVPKLGAMPIDSITANDVVAVLLPVWSEKPETGRRVRRMVSAIMRWSIVAGHRIDDPSASIDPALPKAASAPAKHFRALPHAEVSEAIATVRSSGAWAGTKLAIQFIAYTGCRSGEARSATWDEIDTDTRVVWSIPAERTKMAKPMRVPLSTGALRVLDEARQLGDDLLFPSATGKVLRDTTLAKLMRDHGLGSVHGLRASLRTYFSDTGVDHAAAELALGHAIGNATVAAYARSDMLEARRPIMQKWNDYLEHRRTA